MLTCPVAKKSCKRQSMHAKYPNQPSISYKKFVDYTKVHAKVLASSAGMKKWRIKTDCFSIRP